MMVTIPIRWKTEQCSFGGNNKDESGPREDVVFKLSHGKLEKN